MLKWLTDGLDYIWNGITDFGEDIYDGVKDIWDDITGASSAKENVKETNKTNLQQTTQTNDTNYKIAQETNALNRDIAEQNLGFQRELQEYNKALQQKIFDREDTSYQRTATDMLKAGLNPLSMQGTNGSGEAIALSPLQNQFQAQQSAPMQAAHFENANLPIMTGNQILSSVSGLLTGINQLRTGKMERDSLQLENDRKAIENYLLANRAGIKDYSQKKWNYLSGQDISSNHNFDWDSEKYENERMMRVFQRQNYVREYQHKVNIGRYDSDTDMEKMFTAIMDWTVNGRSEQELKKLREKYPLIDMALSFINGYKNK